MTDTNESAFAWVNANQMEYMIHVILRKKWLAQSDKPDEFNIQFSPEHIMRIPKENIIWRLLKNTYVDAIPMRIDQDTFPPSKLDVWRKWLTPAFQTEFIKRPDGEYLLERPHMDVAFNWTNACDRIGQAEMQWACILHLNDHYTSIDEQNAFIKQICTEIKAKDKESKKRAWSSNVILPMTGWI